MNYELKFLGNREGEKEFFPVTVPGDIQKDYGEFKNFGDHHFGLNATKFDAIEDSTWYYVAKFDYKENGEKIFFTTKGIDYECECFINDTLFFTHEGMFEGFECDITELLKNGENTLKIKILPPPKRADAPFGRKQADESVKPPASYGWDWHPRLIPSGLWQGVQIESRKDTDFGKVNVSYDLSADFSFVTVHFDVNSTAEIKYSLFDKEGKCVAETLNGCFTLQNPNLWWCRGQGEQYLYTWTAESATCKKSGTVGFRRTELITNEGAWDELPDFPKSRTRPPITICLNGRKIFAKGSNIVEPDIFTGNVTDKHYEDMVRLAAQANMNIFRMWGGAGVQKDIFYDYCDKYGIMVWQEFTLACNNYKNVPHYLEVLETEARAIVRNLRFHPCLVMWCGGNELLNSWSRMTEQSHALRLLDKICYEEDRNTPFIFASPLDGMSHGPYLFKMPGYNDEEVHAFINKCHYTAYTEFGCGAITDYEILKEIIPENELDFPTPTETWKLHHGMGAWITESWVSLDILRHYFGEMKTTEQCCEYGAWLQREGYKAIFEAARRQKPYCSMALNWCYNEPWKVAAGNSLLAYPARPKPSYYAVKDSLRDVVASAQIEKFSYKSGDAFTASIWLINDLVEEVTEDIEVSVEIGGKSYYLMTWENATAKANESKEGHSVRFVLPYVENVEFFEVVLKTKNHGENRYKLHYQINVPVITDVNALNF